jgi:hypothetical protein
MAGGHGGFREGAGRKNADWVPPEGRADYEIERARHEKIKADQREHKLAIERGEYLPRETQRQAAATALAVLTQSLRSIPDNLERVCGLTPEQADLAAQQIDAALSEVAAAFRMMSDG